MMKKTVRKLICGACAALLIASNLVLPLFAANIFDYDRFINDPNYEVRAETRNNAELYYWGTAYPDKVTDTGERLLLYYLFNSRDAKEKAGYRLFEQKVHLVYRLPSAYTSLYTPGRTYRYYMADFLSGNNNVTDDTFEDFIDSYQYKYSYKDYNRDGTGGAKPGETEAYLSGLVTAIAPTIQLYHLKYGSKTLTMEEAAQKQYEELARTKEANSDDRKTITLDRQDSGDSILLVYHSFWDDSSEDTKKTYRNRDGVTTLIEEATFENILESYEYYYYTRIPGISDVYTVNHLILSRLTLYRIGLISPKKEAVDLYNDMMAKWQASVAMAPLLYGMMPEIVADEPITYEGFEAAGVTQNALNTPGEDGGVSVPAAIVIGVLGGGAAVAGAAAASGGGDDRKRNQKTYKMYVQKDFGDAIRRGADKPVAVRARMAEIEGATERDRNDLTGKINVSADGMTVHSAALSGRYLEASVSIPADNTNDTASVTFTYASEGGSFTNTVVFRIVDGPALKFVDDRDGTLYGENCGIDAIPGDGFTYTERFMIVDAPVAPKLSDITAVNTGQFDVEFALTDQPALYKMTVKNNTPPEPDHDVFARVREERFEIHVTVEGEKEPVKGYVTMNMYPEGITVSSRDEGKKNDIMYVRIQAYEKDYAGDLDKKWQVSEMQLTLAVKGRDKAIIDPEGKQYRFEKLKGAGGKGTSAAKEQTIADKYNYKESWGDWNGKFTYTFEPQDRLWEPDNGTFFMTLLPVSCEYDGTAHNAEIPLRLRGKDMDPMEAWEKEYEKTRERIEKFSLPEQKAYNLQQLEKIASNDTVRISTWELRLMSKDIVRAYMKYWTEQHDKEQWTANALDWTVWGLDWVKWIGDCAFSYVVAAYTGPLEAIITPAKDVLVNAIGEVGVNIVWGTKFDVKNLEIYDQIKNAGDNFVSGGVADGVGWLASSGMSSPAKIKYACAIMGGYFVFAVFNNYLLSLEKGENDFYGAIMGAFKDMTVTALKIAASMMFKQWLDSPKFKKEIGPKISDYINRKLGENSALNKFLGENFGNKAKIDIGDQSLSGQLSVNVGNKEYWMKAEAEIKKSEIVEKYLTELAGVGGAFVHDHLDTVQSILGFWVKANSLMFSFPLTLAAAAPDAADVTAATAAEFTVDLDLTAILTNTASGMFGWFYDMFFGGLPSADDLMEIPKDPPLPPARN